MDLAKGVDHRVVLPIATNANHVNWVKITRTSAFYQSLVTVTAQGLVNVTKRENFSLGKVFA